MLRILLQQVRRDRVTLPIWILGTAGLLTATGFAVVQEFGDSVDELLTVALATPALLALRGIPNGDSLGSAMHFQGFAWLAVMVGLMNVFLATRHGRADEERGRRELLAATPIARLTPPLATVVLAIAANAAFAALATGGYVAAGFDAAGAVLSATALALIGLAFFGIALVAGELAPTSRSANGIGVVAVLAAYALRAAGDALGTPDIPGFRLAPAWPSYLSPIGWGQLTLPFTADDWTPVSWIAALAAVTVAAGLLLHARRELGASLLRERTGRATGGPRGVLGLAWRLQWPTLLAWTGGAALLGVLLGSLVTAIAGSDVSSPALEAVLTSLGHTDRADLGRALIPALLGLVGILAGAAGVQSVLRLRDEETEGRAEQVLAGPVGRTTWLGAGLAVGVASTLVVLVVTGVAALLGFAAAGNPDDGWLSFGQALAQAPAALALVGVAALAFGVLPRAAVGIGWGAFGLGAVWGLFGALFGAPDWALRLSPYFDVPALPADDTTDWGPLVVVALLAVVAGVLALATFRRRDLVT